VRLRRHWGLAVEGRLAGEAFRTRVRASPLARRRPRGASPCCTSGVLRGRRRSDSRRRPRSGWVSSPSERRRGRREVAEGRAPFQCLELGTCILPGREPGPSARPRRSPWFPIVARLGFLCPPVPKICGGPAAGASRQQRTCTPRQQRRGAGVWASRRAREAWAARRGGGTCGVSGAAAWAGCLGGPRTARGRGGRIAAGVGRLVRSARPCRPRAARDHPRPPETCDGWVAAEGT